MVWIAGESRRDDNGSRVSDGLNHIFAMTAKFAVSNVNTLGYSVDDEVRQQNRHPGGMALTLARMPPHCPQSP